LIVELRRFGIYGFISAVAASDTVDASMILEILRQAQDDKTWGRRFHRRARSVTAIV
jgi:hypothetical protein